MLRLALIVVAGCGRIAFDPIGEGPGGDGDGGTTGDGMMTSGDGGVDAPPVTCTSTYGSGANGFLNGTSMTTMINLPANSMANTLIVVQIYWASNTGSVSMMTDTNGNTYTAATGSTRNTSTQMMYIAPYSIGGAGMLTVTFTAPVPNPTITYATYQNVNLASPMAGIASTAQGNGISPFVAPASVTGPAMLVAGLTSNASSATAGTGYQKRASLSGSHIQDRCAATNGSYDATATLSASGTWILQLVPIRML